MSEDVRRTLRYVEPLSDTRTPLADFFSILLKMTQAKKKMGTEAGNAILESAQGLPFGATLKKIMNAGFFDAGLETRFKKILRAKLAGP